MSLIRGCFNSVSILQKVFPYPVHLDLVSLQLKKAPDSQPQHRAVWNVEKNCIRFLLAFSLWRVFWVISNWSQLRDLEQLGLYTLLVTVLAIGAVGCRVLEGDNRDAFCYAVSQFLDFSHKN